MDLNTLTQLQRRRWLEVFREALPDEDLDPIWIGDVDPTAEQVRRFREVAERRGLEGRADVFAGAAGQGDDNEEPPEPDPRPVALPVHGPEPAPRARIRPQQDAHHEPLDAVGTEAQLAVLALCDVNTSVQLKVWADGEVYRTTGVIVEIASNKKSAKLRLSNFTKTFALPREPADGRRFYFIEMSAVSDDAEFEFLDALAKGGLSLDLSDVYAIIEALNGTAGLTRVARQYRLEFQIFLPLGEHQVATWETPVYNADMKASDRERLLLYRVLLSTLSQAAEERRSRAADAVSKHLVNTLVEVNTRLFELRALQHPHDTCFTTLRRALSKGDALHLAVATARRAAPSSPATK